MSTKPNICLHWNSFSLPHCQQSSIITHTFCVWGLFTDQSVWYSCGICYPFFPPKNRHLYEAILGGQRAEYQCHDYIINPPANGRFRKWLNFKILNLSMKVNLSGMLKERHITCYLGSHYCTREICAAFLLLLILEFLLCWLFSHWCGLNLGHNIGKSSFCCILEWGCVLLCSAEQCMGGY